jgi:hypothetical protein
MEYWTVLSVIGEHQMIPAGGHFFNAAPRMPPPSFRFQGLLRIAVILTPEIEEQNAARRYALIDQAATAAAQMADQARLPNLIKIAGDAHNQLSKLRENNLNHKKDLEKVIPVEKVRELITGNLQMARHLLENLPEVMATRITTASENVSEITRVEVNAILRELSTTVSSVSWLNPSAPIGNDIPATH